MIEKSKSLNWWNLFDLLIDRIGYSIICMPSRRGERWDTVMELRTVANSTRRSSTERTIAFLEG